MILILILYPADPEVLLLAVLIMTDWVGWCWRQPLLVVATYPSVHRGW